MCVKRTDLAVEIRESIEQEELEVKGVVLEEKTTSDGMVKVTKVVIRTRQGEQIMGKPMGTYMTLEMLCEDEENQEQCDESLQREIVRYLGRMFRHLCPQGGRVLVAGLGNREATPDSLGPRIVGRILVKEQLCAVAPGVMAQTGMETYDILSGIVEKTKPSALLVVDALAARSTTRLMRTVQITDTGICPGAGIGNHRKALNKENMEIPVIAVGVPTVVDAQTIVWDRMEQFLGMQGLSEEEIGLFLQDLNQEGTLGELFVTPKDIDASIERMGVSIAAAINKLFEEKR